MLIGPGLLEGIMGSTKYCDPSYWTLEEEWNSSDGDLSAINSEFTSSSISGFAWSPDGSKLTISCGSKNLVVTFSCSTPWDPNTASELATRGPAGNPNCMSFINGGASFLILYAVGDNIYRFPAGNYIISETLSEHSICTKSEVGFTGTTDGGFTASHSATDGQFIYWLGDDGSQVPRLKYVTFPSWDLDSPNVGSTSGSLVGTPLGSFSTENSMSTPNVDGDKFFHVAGGSASLITLPNGVGDLSSITQGSQTDIGALMTGTWNIGHIWVDPTNAEYVWVAGTTFGGQQLAKFKQNCP